jgi:hypothetical protein
MSSALAAARNRRAQGASMQNEQPPVQNMQQQSQSQNTGLTLPQVITLVDKRLTTLEQFMQQQTESSNTEIVKSEIPNNLDSIVEEFNTRYSILAEEIDSMKNLLMKLQSFTMEVNKALLDERIRIFSDIDNINTNLEITKNGNFNKIDYLEQIGEFSMSNEIANYNNVNAQL